MNARTERLSIKFLLVLIFYVLVFSGEKSPVEAKWPTVRKCQRYESKYKICDYNSATKSFIFTCHQIFKKNHKAESCYVCRRIMKYCQRHSGPL